MINYKIIEFVDNIYYISNKIKLWIKNNDLMNEEYENNYYKIELYWKKSDNLYSKEIMKNIINICDFMKMYSGYNNNKILCLIFLSPYKKKIPKIKKKLSYDEINSGCSVYGNYICIWRYEELYKVLFHELIHCFGLDINADRNVLKSYVKNKFKIIGNESLGEAYTDALAVILYTLYFSRNDNYINNLNNQIKFIKLQAEKIISYIPQERPYKTDTSIYSYYILKYALLTNLKDLFKLIKLNKTGKDLTNDYLKIITKSYENIKLNIINISNRSLRMTFTI